MLQRDRAVVGGLARERIDSSRETARQAQRDRLRSMQEEAAKKVAVNFRKMRELRASLNALGTPRSDKEALKFVAAYLKEVDRELDKLEEDDTDN